MRKLVVVALTTGALATVVLLSACGDDPASGSSGSSGTSGSGGSANTTSANPGAAQTCVDAINAYRAGAGLPALERWSDQEGCSDGEAKSDAETNKPHGAFGRCQEMAQNECPGHPGPPEKMIEPCLEMMWNEGPGGGHHDNMASTKYKKVACGFFTTSEGKVWSVQNFR